MLLARNYLNPMLTPRVSFPDFTRSTESSPIDSLLNTIFLRKRDLRCDTHIKDWTWEDISVDEYHVNRGLLRSTDLWCDADVNVKKFDNLSLERYCVNGLLIRASDLSREFDVDVWDQNDPCSDRHCLHEILMAMNAMRCDAAVKERRWDEL